MIESPDGVYDVFYVKDLPSLHPAVYQEKGGKTVFSEQHGFLTFGQYKTGYPQQSMRAYFSLMIDDNQKNDANVAILDVYDHHSDRVLAKNLLTRKDFVKSQESCLFYFDFIPPSAQANMEFRIYYMGGCFLHANIISVVNPQRCDQDEMLEFVRNYERTAAISGEMILSCQSLTPEICQQANIKVVKGRFENNAFYPGRDGALEYQLTLDSDREYIIEFGLRGNIAHKEKGELNGGKVSLLDIKEHQGHYSVELQRMSGDYRGGGLFRLSLSNVEHAVHQGAAWCITHRELAGHYSMNSWRDEAHRIKASLRQNGCQLSIDTYQSKRLHAPYSISGTHTCTLVFGNRNGQDQAMGQGACTYFTDIKIYIPA